MGSKNNKKQGSKANNNGRTAEEVIEPAFKNNGYKIVAYSKFETNRKKIERMNKGEFKPRKPVENYCEEDKLVLTNCPYTSIYQHRGKTEYVIVDKPKNRRIRVEMKWQQSSGSVDEKFPYVYLNAVLAYKEKEVIIIIDGGGYKEGAREWIKNQCKERWLMEDKKITVMSIQEFVMFMNNDLVYSDEKRRPICVEF